MGRDTSRGRVAPTAATAHREARPADLPRLRALQGYLARPLPALLTVAVADDPSGDGPIALVTDAAGGHTAEPVGYGLALPGGPVEDVGQREGRGCIHVAELVVAPGYRREGRGSALLDAMEETVSGRDALRLTARSDDGGALAFYRSNGFRAVGTLPEHYGDDDGVVLVRE